MFFTGLLSFTLISMSTSSVFNPTVMKIGTDFLKIFDNTTLRQAQFQYVFKRFDRTDIGATEVKLCHGGISIPVELLEISGTPDYPTYGSLGMTVECQVDMKATANSEVKPSTVYAGFSSAVIPYIPEMRKLSPNRIIGISITVMQGNQLVRSTQTSIVTTMAKIKKMGFEVKSQDSAIPDNKTNGDPIELEAWYSDPGVTSADFFPNR